MGVFRLIKGIVKIGEGIIDGDGEKIAKGGADTAIGAITTLTGGDNDDDKSDDDE